MRAARVFFRAAWGVAELAFALALVAACVVIFERAPGATGAPCLVVGVVVLASLPWVVRDTVRDCAYAARRDR